MCVRLCAWDPSCVLYVTRSCVNAALNINQTSKPRFVWCLSFWGSGFIRESVRVWWAPWGFERGRQTDRHTDGYCFHGKKANYAIKAWTFSILYRHLGWRREGTGNRLSCITFLQQNIFCLFWSAKHICRFVGLPQTNLHHNRTERGFALWFPNQPSESQPEWALPNTVYRKYDCCSSNSIFSPQSQSILER